MACYESQEAPALAIGGVDPNAVASAVERVLNGPQAEVANPRRPPPRGLPTTCPKQCSKFAYASVEVVTSNMKRRPYD